MLDALLEREASIAPRPAGGGGKRSCDRRRDRQPGAKTIDRPIRRGPGRANVQGLVEARSRAAGAAGSREECKGLTRDFSPVRTARQAFLRLFSGEAQLRANVSQESADETDSTGTGQAPTRRVTRLSPTPRRRPAAPFAITPVGLRISVRKHGIGSLCACWAQRVCKQTEGDIAQY
jgi:hypothetical protein